MSLALIRFLTPLVASSSATRSRTAYIRSIDVPVFRRFALVYAKSWLARRVFLCPPSPRMCPIPQPTTLLCTAQPYTFSKGPRIKPTVSFWALLSSFEFAPNLPPFPTLMPVCQHTHTRIFVCTIRSAPPMGFGIYSPQSTISHRYLGDCLPRAPAYSL